MDNNQRKSRKDSPERKEFFDCLEKHFPGKSRVMIVCLAVKAMEMIMGITLPFCLILIARPGSGKSTITYIIKELGNCYYTDSFTVNAFVTHMANVKEDQLSKIDLLPKIRNKTLITPELAPIFNQKGDKLEEIIGILTRILDGKGYKRDSGAHTQRGYDGNFFFTWIGAVVEISKTVWQSIGNAGPKMYFFRIPEEEISQDEKRKQILEHMNDKSYDEKLKEVSSLVKSFWESLKSNVDGDKVVWNKSKDDPYTMEKIVLLAQLISMLRASIPTSNTAHSSGSDYGYEQPTIEDPERAADAMYNLAKGSAFLDGRNHIIRDDLTVVRDVALSCGPRTRIELFNLLIEHDGELTTSQIVLNMNVTKSTALKYMLELTLVGLVSKTKIPMVTKPEDAIILKDDYDWFLSDEFRSL